MFATKATPAMAAILGFALPGIACAQSADAWRYQGTLYVYAPTISGKTIFPESEGGSSASIDGAGTPIKEMTFDGPAVAVSFRW